MDFEGEYNLHEYGERLCLMQIFDGESFYIMDPFTVEEISLRRILENTDILKVIFDSGSDQALLRKSHGICLKTILDLKPAVDLLGSKSGGLSEMLNRYLGIEIAKKNKYQKHNWTRRPIDQMAIEYALSDVKNLLVLKDVLLERLFRAGKLDEYILRNCKIQDSRKQENERPRIFRNKKYRTLTKSQKHRLKELYNLRDRYAKQVNWPPNNVLSNEALYDITKGDKRIEHLSINPKIPSNIRREIMEGLKNLE